MPSPIKVAFIGVDHPHGAGWRELLLNFADELELTAIVTGFDNATRSLEERLVRLPRYETVDELIEEAEFDAAIVCLPNNSAAIDATKLAEAGKHVLLEKPGGASSRDLESLQEAVELNEIAFQTGYMWRYDEGADRLRAMVQDGRFGRLISAEMSFFTSDVRRRGEDHYLFDPEISGGGFFNWLGCHFLDLLFYITGQSIVGVTARADVFGPKQIDVDDGGVAVLDLSDGGIATFIGGYWLPRWKNESHWCIRGSERWVRWQPGDDKHGGLLEIEGPQPHWYAMEEKFSLPVNQIRGYGGYRGIALVNDWIKAMRTGEPCRNTVDGARAVLEVLDAIYQSSDRGYRMQCLIAPG